MTQVCADSNFDASLDDGEGETKCVGPFDITVYGSHSPSTDTIFWMQIFERDPEKTCGVLIGHGWLYAGSAKVGDKINVLAEWFGADHDPTEDASIEVIAFTNGVATLRICRGDIPGEPGDLPEYTTYAECTAAGYYWYDGSCHSSPAPTIEEPEPDPEAWSCYTGTHGHGGTESNNRIDGDKEYRIVAEFLEVTTAGSVWLNVEFKKDWYKHSEGILLAPGESKTYTDPGGIDWIVQVSSVTGFGLWASAKFSACYSIVSPVPPEEEPVPDPEAWSCYTGTHGVGGYEANIRVDGDNEYRIVAEFLEGTTAGAKLLVKFKMHWSKSSETVTLAPGESKTYTDPGGIDWIVHVSATRDLASAKFSVCYAIITLSWWDALLERIRGANEEITAPITDLFPSTDIEGWTSPPFECPICKEVYDGEGSELEYAKHLMSHITAFERGWFHK